jgi:hypothetical protein
LIAAEPELLTAFQQHEMIAVKPRLNLFNAVSIDNHRAVNPQEDLGVEFPLQAGKRFPDLKCTVRRVGHSQITGSFYPVNAPLHAVPGDVSDRKACMYERLQV